jgi:signal transduction histidine kinase
MLYITTTTSELKKIITLHSVEILRQDLIIRIQNVERDLLTVHTELGGSLDKIVSNVTDLDRSIKGCAGCHHSPLVARKLDDIKGYIDKFETSFSYYITAAADEQRIKALKMESYAISTELLKITLEMSLIADQRLKERTQKAIDDVRNAQRTLIVTLFISFLIGLWIAFRLTKKIVRPVRELTAVSRKIASGDLGYTTAYSDSTEFGELARSFNDMSVSLRNMQEQLVQAAKLAAIGELASNVAHEINNPLTSIMGYAELIEEEADVSDIMKDIDVIKKESLRARGIVQQLLDFARKRPLEIGAVDINNLIEEVIALVGIQMKDSRIRLEEEYSALPPIMVDANQIKQVFLNILNNSVHALSESQRGFDRVITIRTSSRDSRVCVEISDTGCGIPGEVLPRIFEPFFTTKQEHGTGLGLSITYKIIQSHKGSIDVRSEEGRGTTFIVSLPVGISANATAPARDKL